MTGGAIPLDEAKRKQAGQGNSPPATSTVSDAETVDEATGDASHL